MREKYSRRFQHVLVDEFQDTNFAQYTLLKHLASTHNNIFVVGDPDQSVYRWRGADYRNVQRFEQDFPDAQVILLEQNYRSKQTILDAAMAVIDRNPHRRRKNLFTERGSGEKVTYYEALDDYGEAQLRGGHDCQPGRQPEGRTGRLRRDVPDQRPIPPVGRSLPAGTLTLPPGRRTALLRAARGQGHYRLLRLVHNPVDEISLDRVINLPPRGIGEKTVLALHTAGHSANTSPSALLMDLGRADASPFWSQFSGRAAQQMSEFGAMLANWRNETSRASVTELFDRITSDIHYQDYIDDGTEEGTERWENVKELRRLTTEYDDRTLNDFLETVALISDQDTLSEGKNAPTLLTLHAAKGLEFGVVFIVGLDDGIIPHSRSFDEAEAMEEERRLFYVGITRAEDRLYLLRAQRRGGRGYSEETIPSRYLDDIPAELLAGKTRRGTSFRSTSRAAATPTWLRADPVPPPVVEAKYQAGMRVGHPTWGEGIVLNSRLQDNDETVDVVFESVGIKRLAASLANLSILKSVR